MKLVTAAEMREFDAVTIRDLAVPGVVLMESAGRGVVDVIAALPEVVARGGVAGLRVAVVAGPGNNGGDGFVIARHLHQRGAAVALLLVAAAERVAGDARIHFDAACRAGVAVHDFRAEAAPDQGLEAGRRLDGAELIVDALLGTGAARDVAGHLAAVIERMNRAPGLRIAVDLPSGLDADRGQPRPLCVAADHTVSFAFAKLGLVTSPGFVHAGVLHVVDIGIPARLAERVTRVQLDDGCLAALQAPSPPLAHKGSFGHALLVAGSSGHTGAALLCAEACARAGAGLVTVASPDEAQRALAARVVEAMTAPLGPEPLDGALAWAALEPLLAGKQAVGFGPGLPSSDGTRDLLARLLACFVGPLVVDAEALNRLATDLSRLAPARGRVVLTPHPAEMGRLAGVSTEVVQADRVAVAEAFAARHGVVVLLKGARTVIADPGGRTAINPSGGPWLGSGGSGDVLTGVIAALLSGGMAPFEAACAGAYLHGRAGDLARDARGERGVIARDVIEQLPRARRGVASRARPHRIR